MEKFSLKENKYKKRIIPAGIVSILVLIILFFIPSHTLLDDHKLILASNIMQKSILKIQDYLKSIEFPFDQKLDPNETGIIGPAESGIATTIGNLSAKRTTTNPNFAGLIAFLLKKAGIKKGDTVAIGCSASFPALMIAALSAVKALNLKPVIILSLGSSSYGATNLKLTLLDIYMILYKEGFINIPPDLITLGGDKDIGRDMPSQTVEKLKRVINKYRLPLLIEPDLRKNITKRIKIYKKYGRFSAFINTGGSYVNMGINSLVLKVKPGLNTKPGIVFPPPEQRGMIFEMLSRHIPVIHLLFIKGLAQKYNLPWDPVPLPKPGSQKSFLPKTEWSLSFIIITGLYLALVILFLALPPKTLKK